MVPFLILVSYGGESLCELVLLRFGQDKLAREGSPARPLSKFLVFCALARTFVSLSSIVSLGTSSLEEGSPARYEFVVWRPNG